MRIDLHAIHYRYPGSKKPVFDGMDLTIKPGITLAMGYSGCGKSTLLRLIAGLLVPNGGRLSTESRHKVGSSAFLRHDVGFVFQQLNLLPLASVRRNIRLALEMAGLDASEGERWIEMLGLSEYADSTPISLSGGQQQRAAIARALAKRPAILLLDEPTSGLDDLNTKVIATAIRNTLAPDAVCVVATHDKRLEHIADEILDFNSFLPLEKHLQTLV